MSPTRKRGLRGPPNAWVLYRRDKVKDLSGSVPRSELSGIISAMWKVETPEVRAHYRHLRDMKKAEYKNSHPGYRLHPMKKTEGESMEAENPAEKERERDTPKTTPQPHASGSQDRRPLHTAEPRFSPACLSPASGASKSPVGHSSSQQLPPILRQPTPPTDLPTSPADHSSIPVALASSSSPYPSPPSTTSFPPLVAPQPRVPHRPPSASDWPQQQQHVQTPPNEQGANALWLEQDSFHAIPQFTSSQEYMTIPMPNQLPQQPPGWPSDDSSPQTYLPFYSGNVLPPTDDSNAFHLGEFDVVDEFIAGSREIEVSMGYSTMGSSMVGSGVMGSGMMGSGMMGSFNDGRFQAFAAFLASLDPTPFEHSDRGMIASSSQQLQSNDYFGMQSNLQSTSTMSTTFDSLGPYSYEQDLQGQDVVEELNVTGATFEPGGTQATLPYMPPAGALSSSRRVAAEWRYIQRTPEPEVDGTDLER